MILPTYPEKNTPNFPKPQKRKNFHQKLLVKGPGAHLPGSPVGEILETTSPNNHIQLFLTWITTKSVC